MNTWLGNGYVEIRHLSRDLLGEPKIKSKGDVETGQGGDNDLSLEYNYLSKQIRANRREKNIHSKREVVVNAQSSSNKATVDTIVASATEPNSNSPLKTTTIKVDEGLMVNDVVYPDDYSGNPAVDGLFKRKPFSAAAAVGAVTGSTSASGVKANQTAPKVGGDSKKTDGDTADDQVPGGFSATNSSKFIAEMEADDDSDDEMEVIERGYDSEDEFYMNEHQKGKVAGIEAIHDSTSKMWAASGLKDASITAKRDGVVATKERVVVRRLQSEGPRLDTEIIALPGGHTGEVSKSRQAKQAQAEGWVKLTDPREIEVYSMAIASDPGARRKLLPSVISRSKLRYLYVETFGDLSFQVWGTFDFWVTLLVFVMSIWVRTYIHYIGQYFFLQAIPTPVYGFKIEPYQLAFKYMSVAIEPQYEVGVVAIGPLTNLVFFLLLAVSGLGFYKIAGYMPESGSKFIASFGVATIIDPFLVLLVDVMSKNYNCAGVYPDTCGVDYTSSDCNCFNGDFLKLWYRFDREEGSGVTGLFITVILYICISVISALLFYEYMLRVHRDAMILDLWRRIDAPAEEFFIPHDFEVSHEELYSICAKAHLWRGMLVYLVNTLVLVDMCLY